MIIAASRKFPLLLTLSFCCFFLPLQLSAQPTEPSNTPSNSQAVILQYHHVSNETPPITSIAPQDFQRHMNYLFENNFNILPLEQILNSLINDEELPDYTAAITFDDAYLSVYTEAFPILKELNWPFSVFVTTGLVDTNSSLYANWTQLREMAAAGATIANHTVNHPYFLERQTNESESDWLQSITEEITAAEEKILQETGQSHRLIAYPYGEYEPRIQALVEELGYRGIAQHSGPINKHSDFSALPRFPLSGIYVSMNTFPNKVKSLAFTLDSITPSSPISAEPSPSIEIDFSNDMPSLNQLTCFNNGEVINIDVLDAESARVRVSTPIENSSRRFRYNCTAPGPDGRYYWYSVPWINPAVSE